VTFVVDASAAVALVSQAVGTGPWVRRAVAAEALAAPELMLFEAANLLRRLVLRGGRDAASASLAHADLLAMSVERYPYSFMARRAWQLRDNLTLFDASYVALAELLDAPLVTLDARLARATGPRCAFLVYSGTD
jgi:predicted nucleic acid-binding protein